MKKIIGLAALLAGTAGMFVLPAAEGRRTNNYTVPAYTQNYNNGYDTNNRYANANDSRAYYNGGYDTRSYYGDRDRHDRDRHNFDRGRRWDRDDRR